jgi:hypothetical protein
MRRTRLLALGLFAVAAVLMVDLRRAKRLPPSLVDKGDGELPAVRFNPGGAEHLPAVLEHDHVTGSEIWRRVLEQAEVVTGCVMEAVDRHLHAVSAALP